VVAEDGGALPPQIPTTHYARAQSVGVDTVPPPAHPMTRPPARQTIEHRALEKYQKVM